jgi:hypothetical protein
VSWNGVAWLALGAPVEAIVGAQLLVVVAAVQKFPNCAEVGIQSMRTIGTYSLLLKVELAEEHELMSP